jgi:three-Cys-motif partner protein
MNHAEYLEPIPDGLATRPSGSWVVEKLDYVRRYIDIFETSMRSKWSQRNYIDLFAGPGKNVLKDTRQVLLGSPLLSLVTKYPFTSYYFSDLNLDNIEALKQRCAISPLINSAHFYIGDANRIVSMVVENIRQFSQKSLNLAFLDPEGLELDWHTVAQLGTLRCDLIIHYSQQGISRFIGKAYKSDDEAIVDRFFGTNDWRPIYARYNRPRRTGMHRELLDLYKERLESLGYQEVIQSDKMLLTEPLIRNKRRNAPLYRLIFASKHRLGDEFWHKIIRRDLYG